MERFLAIQIGEREWPFSTFSSSIITSGNGWLGLVGLPPVLRSSADRRS